MASFRSYAGQGSRSTLRAPDVASKLRERDQQQLRNMQQAAQFDLQNRDRMAQAMEYANSIEAQNRQRYFQAEAENKAAIQAQIQRNYDIQIANIEARNKTELANLQAFSQFSKTAADTISTIQENLEEARKVAIADTIYQTGATANQMVELSKFDRNATDQALYESKAVQELTQGGASIQQIRFLVENSAAENWINNKTIAQRLGYNYTQEFNQNLDTPYKVGDREMTLSEAYRNADPESAQIIISQIRRKYFTDNSIYKISAAAADAYIYPSIRAVETQFTQGVNSNYRKIKAKEAEELRFRAYENKIQLQGGGGLVEEIERAPNKTVAKADMLSFFQTAAQGDDWELYNSAWQDALNQQITFNGKQTTFGELNKNDANVIATTKAFLEARKNYLQQFRDQEQERIINRESAARDFLNQAAEQGIALSDADIEAIEQKLDDEFGAGYDSSILENYKQNNTQNAIYRRDTVKQLTDLANRGLLTEERLESMGVDVTIANQFRGIARQIGEDRRANGNFKPQMDAIADMVKSPPQIQAKPDGTYNYSVRIMASQLQEKFLTKYAQLKAAGNPNAVDDAFTFVQNEFKKIASNEASFSKNPDDLGGYVSVINRKAPSQASAARMEWVQGGISRLGSKALDSNGAIFTISELNTIESDMQRLGRQYKPDPMAEYVGRMFGVDPLTVINRQRIAAGKTPMQLPESAVTFSQTVNPALKRILDAYRTPEVSTRAMSSTRAYNEALVPKGYGPMVTSAANSAGISPTLVAAFAEAENGSWDPNALSMGGAAAGVGLMQLNQSYFGEGSSISQREASLKNPQLNLNTGAKELARLAKAYNNNMKDVVYAWNMGEAGYANWIAQGRPNTAQAGYAEGLYQRFEKARAKYGDVEALRSPGVMRQSMRRMGRASFERPSSVVYEDPSGQPGVDLFFESKRFPAVLSGVVKDVSSERGYGNYVVIESTDPMTGQKVDVLYAHLADGIRLTPGQEIDAGDIIGTQGGTGNVRSADGTIASIDFLAPAPRGSKSMAPYSNFDRLRRYVVQQMQQ